MGRPAVVDNFMYFGNPGLQLLRVGLDGTGRTVVAPGSYSDVDHRDAVLYANGVGQIDKYSVSGAGLGRFALTSGTSPRQAAFMEDGTMLAAVRPNKLYHFGSNRQVLRLFGDGSRDSLLFSLNFAQSREVLIDGDRDVPHRLLLSKTL